MTQPDPDDIRLRTIRSLLIRCAPDFRRDFLKYDRELRRRGPPVAAAWGEVPESAYWNDFPGWILRASRGRSVTPEFVDAVSRGQTCLFYSVRIQDDLLDGHIPPTRLSPAPLIFLTEAERAFASVIGGGARFWGRYRSALGRTVSGILEVARLQRDRLTTPDVLLRAYGDVDAIFSVGGAAVCECIGKPGWIGAVETFVSEMGKVLLCLDDLDDIEEDLRAGRVNYPARVLLADELSAGTDLALLAGEWDRRLDRAAATILVTTLRECLFRAAEAIGPLGLEGVSDLIDRTNAALGQIHESVLPTANHPTLR